MNNLTTSAETNRLRSAPTFFLRFDVGNHTMSVEEKCAKGEERERENDIDLITIDSDKLHTGA